MKDGERLDLRSLEIFLVVCETRSMTDAAERLGITQSAVSYSIVRIERTIGVRLLDRGARPIIITPAGDALRAAALRINDNLQLLRTAIQNIRSGRLRRLRLGLTASLSVPFIPELVKRIRHEVEHITVQSDLASQLRQALVSGNIDVAIMTDALEDEDGFVSRHVLTEPYVLVTPIDLKPVSSVDDLRSLTRDLPLVRWLSGTEMGRDVETQLRRLRISVPRVFEFDGRHALTQMVHEGLAWTVATPITAFDIWRHSDRIRVLPFPGAAFTRKLTAVFREGRYEAIAARLADEATGVLEQFYLPEMFRRAPWLEKLIHTEKPK